MDLCRHSDGRDYNAPYILTLPDFSENWLDWLTPGTFFADISINNGTRFTCLQFVIELVTEVTTPAPSTPEPDTCTQCEAEVDYRRDLLMLEPWISSQKYILLGMST